MTEWENDRVAGSRRLRRSPDRRRPDSESTRSPIRSSLLGSVAGRPSGIYAALTLVGAIALPLTWAAFPRLADRGFGFARIAGLVIATYAMRCCSGQAFFPTAVCCPGLVWLSLRLFRGLAFRAAPAMVRETLRVRRRALVISEGVFAAGFLLFLGIRALHPEIYWGEKPMDFSILNILVRARSRRPRTRGSRELRSATTRSARRWSSS